jgi:hypothetical protein
MPCEKLHRCKQTICYQPKLVVLIKEMPFMIRSHMTTKGKKKDPRITTREKKAHVDRTPVIIPR